MQERDWIDLNPLTASVERSATRELLLKVFALCRGKSSNKLWEFQMSPVKHLFVLAGFVAVCAWCSPIPMTNKLAQEALVNCNNEALLRILRKESVPFGCLPGSGVSRDRRHEDEPASPSSASHQQEERRILTKSEVISLRGQEKGKQLKKDDCLDPRSCDSNIQKSALENYFFAFAEPSKACPEGYDYSPIIKKCVEMLLSPVERQREEYFDSNTESLKPRKCKEGYVFDFEQVRCIKNKKIFSVRAEEIVDFSPEYRFTDHKNCPEGTIYVPEVDLCLPVETKPTVINQQVMETVAIPLKEGEKCPEDSVFNPQIGQCLFPIEPSKETEQMPKPVSLVLVDDGKPQSDEGPEYEVVGRPKCERGTEYVPKIDQCVPVKREAPQMDGPIPLSDDPVTQSTPDPFRLVLAPLTADQIGKSKCRPGTVYVSEIDICLEPIS